MHKHDLDLIADLASGSTDREVAARGLIESCAECRAEYDTQLGIIGMLGATPPAAMTDFEKAALHRDLWTELRNPPTKTSSPWWYRWSFVAAGLLIVVGLGTVLDNLGVVGGTAANVETFSEIGSGLSAPEATPEDQTRNTLTDAGGGDIDTQGERGPSETIAPNTTVMSTTTVTTAPAENDYEVMTASARTELDKTEPDLPEVTPEVSECLDQLSLTDQILVKQFETGGDLVVVASNEPEPDTVFTVVRLDPCAVVFTDR
jgi:hypothetical protein